MDNDLLLYFHSTHSDQWILDYELQPKIKLDKKPDVALISVHKKSGKLWYFISAGNDTWNFETRNQKTLPESAKNLFLLMKKRSRITTEMENGNERLVSCMPVNGEILLYVNNREWKKRSSPHTYAILTADDTVYSAFRSKHYDIKDMADPRLPYPLTLTGAKIVKI